MFIELTNISRWFGQNQALIDVTLRLETGRIGLLGGGQWSEGRVVQAANPEQVLAAEHGRRHHRTGGAAVWHETSTLWKFCLQGSIALNAPRRRSYDEPVGHVGPSAVHDAVSIASTARVSRVPRVPCVAQRGGGVV